MKKYFFFFFAILISFSTFAQDYAENKKKFEKIKSSKDYYYGYSGNQKTIEDAENFALLELLSDIQKRRKSDVIMLGNDSQEYISKVFETFRQDLEQNADELILHEGDDKNQTAAYISRATFETFVAEREREIREYLHRGLNAEKNENFGDALRFYYFSLMILYSHPDGDDLSCEVPGLDVPIKIHKFLTQRIDGNNGMLSEINFIETGRHESNGGTQIEYRIQSITGGNEITNVSFRYNNGNYYETTTVENGKSFAFIKTPKYTAPMELTIDLTYPDMRHEASKGYAMQQYLSQIKKLPSFSHIKRSTIAKAGRIEQQTEKGKVTETPKTPETPKVQFNPQEIMAKIENSIAKQNPNSVREYFNEEGFEMFTKACSYGKPTIIGHPEYTYYTFKNDVVCRSLPIRFYFKKKSFDRDLIFRFDATTGLISAVVFRLSNIAEQQIEENTPNNLYARYTLQHFMEDYQTAFALQQIDYLDKIFSDDALIIIGRKINPTKRSDQIKLNDPVTAERTRLSKAQYINNLRKKFNSPYTEYINIHFTDFEVKPVSTKRGALFGIQVRQYYYSNTYNDVGFLFILVDLRNNDPLIHVRTWQEGETPMDELITLGEFRF